MRRTFTLPCYVCRRDPAFLGGVHAGCRRCDIIRLTFDGIGPEAAKAAFVALLVAALCGHTEIVLSAGV